MSVAALRNLNALRALSRTLRPELWRRVGRWLVIGLAYAMIAIGAVGAVLPGHLGAPVLAAGLVVALRSSFRARRQFVEAQRRHPKILFPVRRLLRREPEVAPVAWQAVLRLERQFVPRRLLVAVKARRRLRRQSSRSTSSASAT